MATSRIIYNGNLRTSSEHLASGTMVLSDAPKDNHGLGEGFSPTDSVANALGTCMLTMMGIKAQNSDINLKGMEALVTKTMASEPRRIKKIEVAVKMPSHIDAKNRQVLERVARTCPVAQSLSSDVEQVILFDYIVD